MAKKEIFTIKEVERDVANSFRYAPEMTEESYQKWMIPCAVLGILLAIASYFYPAMILRVMGVLIGVAIVSVVVHVLRTRHKMRTVCMDDYRIETGTFSHKAHEQYWQKNFGSRRIRWCGHNRQVDIYTLYFENGKSFCLPRDNYAWSREYPMTDFAIYESARRGEEFYLVIHKSSEGIAMVYPREFFEYKE